MAFREDVKSQARDQTQHEGDLKAVCGAVVVKARDKNRQQKQTREGDQHRTGDIEDG